MHKEPNKSTRMMTNVTSAAVLDPELTSEKLGDVNISVLVDVEEDRVLVVRLEISPSSPVIVAAAGTNPSCAVTVPESASAMLLETVIQVDAGSVLQPKSCASRPGSTHCQHCELVTVAGFTYMSNFDSTA
jgi:hypothetical protein